ncbi:hypothetical protein [Streptomyces milbemycinicus]|uniref:hypothetical protein n=1 Tax=Streptomyces milbemycinicus TaxID=476552 RepID=UPI0033DAA28C
MAQDEGHEQGNPSPGWVLVVRGPSRGEALKGIDVGVGVWKALDVVLSPGLAAALAAVLVVLVLLVRFERLSQLRR